MLHEARYPQWKVRDGIAAEPGAVQKQLLAIADAGWSRFHAPIAIAGEAKSSGDLDKRNMRAMDRTRVGNKLPKGRLAAIRDNQSDSRSSIAECLWRRTSSRAKEG